ncbi:MAG: hypothetical protein IPM29_05255 [Planctomycetes bacterium]|nr:hypothetical protein [Planctomycetota bacterium]
MRNQFILAATLAVAAPAFAQNHVLWYYPEGTTQGSTSFTSRHGLAAADDGDACMWYHADFFASCAQMVDSTLPVGQQLVNRVYGWQFLLQDQNAATIQSYELVLIPSDPANPGKPDPNENNTWLRTVPVAAPGGTGIVAWRISTTLATPFDMPNNGDDFHAGVFLPNDAGWSATDGMSVHMTIFGNVSGATVWDLPNLNFPNSGYQLPQFVNAVKRTAAPGGPRINPGVPATGFNNRTMHLGLVVNNRAVTLNMGSVIDPAQRGAGDNPTFGAGGSLPDHAVRWDGMAARISSPAHAGASYVILGGFGFGAGFNWAPGFTLPGLEGDLRVNPALGLYSFGAGALDTAGRASPVIVPYPNGWRFAVGYMGFQAGVLDLATGTVVVSNGSGLFSGD